MLWLQLFSALRNARRAIKPVAAIVSELPLDDVMNLVTTQAAGYGWEVGQGATMLSEVTASPQNPFLNADWRKFVEEVSD